MLFLLVEEFDIFTNHPGTYGMAAIHPHSPWRFNCMDLDDELAHFHSNLASDFETCLSRHFSFTWWLIYLTLLVHTSFDKVCSCHDGLNLSAYFRFFGSIPKNNKNVIVISSDFSASFQFNHTLPKGDPRPHVHYVKFINSLFMTSIREAVRWKLAFVNFWAMNHHFASYLPFSSVSFPFIRAFPIRLFTWSTQMVSCYVTKPYFIVQSIWLPKRPRIGLFLTQHSSHWSQWLGSVLILPLFMLW